MTIIVVSVSWLMAIISIMFGSYTHIKMFFTLCLSMVLWTPILSIINFLNDLNIQKTFELINANDATLTYANYKDVIQKVTANSNFISYLIMLTPMLAYALAKGSEMGFVSIASSLSQQLAGGARAAGGFATQQALSTSTAISSPDGSMVRSLAAGRREYVYAANVGGSVVSMSKIGTGDGMLNDSVTTADGSSLVTGTNGKTLNSNIAGLEAKVLNSQVKTASNDLSNAINEADTKSKGTDWLASLSESVGTTLQKEKGDVYNFGKGHSSGGEISTTDSNKDAETFSFGGSGGINFGKGVNGQINAGYQNTTQEIQDDSIKKGDSYTTSFNNAEELYAKLVEDDGFRANFIDTYKNSDNQTFAKIANSAEAFSQAKSFQETLGVNNHNRIIDNYAEQHRVSKVEALTELEKLAAESNFKELQKYAGVTDNLGINGSHLNTPQEFSISKKQVQSVYKGQKDVVQEEAKDKIEETESVNTGGEKVTWEAVVQNTAGKYKMTIANNLSNPKVRQGRWDMEEARSKAEGKPHITARPE